MRLKKACLSALSILCIPALIVAGPGRGEITGEVTFTGTAAKPQVINMSKFPDCVKLNPKPRMTEDVVTGPGNALQNVVVYVSGGAAGTSSRSPVPAIFDQKDCHFSTHVLAFQAGQELQMSNHDPLAHNIHPMPHINREWNQILLPGTPPSSYTLDSPEFIPVKCNIHPWMRGYFVVLQLTILRSQEKMVDSDYLNFRRGNIPLLPGMRSSAREARKSLQVMASKYRWTLLSRKTPITKLHKIVGPCHFQSTGV